MDQSKIMSRKVAGFSLIELLVVVAVILLLARILMPSLDKAKTTALRIQCANNLHQIGIGIATYSSDNKNRFPAATHNYGHDICNPNNSNLGPTNAGGLGLLISLNYIPFPRDGRKNVFHCPEMDSFSSHWFVYNNPPNDIGTQAQWAAGPPTACSGATNIGYDYRDDGLRAKGWMLRSESTSYAVVSDIVTRANDTDGNSPDQRQHSVGFQRGYFNILYGDGHVKGRVEGLAGTPSNTWCCDGGSCNGADDESCFAKFPPG